MEPGCGGVAFSDVLSCLIFCCRLQSEGDDFFTSYEEVHESFDAMGLQENLLRGIYAYGMFAATRLRPLLLEIDYMFIVYSPSFSH